MLYATLAGFTQREDQLQELRKIAAAYDSSYRAKRARAITASGVHQQADRRLAVAPAVLAGVLPHMTRFSCPRPFVPAFPHDQSPVFFDRVLQTPGGPRPYSDLLFWISFATLAGVPATRSGRDSPGWLPVGIQIMGPYLENATPIDPGRPARGRPGAASARRPASRSSPRPLRSANGPVDFTRPAVGQAFLLAWRSRY